MKKFIALLLALAMALSLAACGTTEDASVETAGGEGTAEDKIVVWTLAADLKQFAEQYTKETGREVEVVVFDSADYETKITSTLGTGSTDVDVFAAEPQHLPNFYEAGFCADISELAGEVQEKLVPYVYEAGTDNGVLRAISYQATPGSVVYRRDLALEVFGTDDPEEIGKLFATFPEITKTAEKLAEHGYTIFGDTGSLRWFAQSSNPWVKDGQIIIDQDRMDYFDTAVALYQNEYVAFAPEWSAAWYASMAGSLPVNAGWTALEEIAEGTPTTEIFSYVMPSWGAVIIRDNAQDNKGKFGICSGVCSFFGGGTFMLVNEYSEHKTAAQDFIEWCTLNEETAQWWLETSNGDVVANMSVLEANKDYENESFGNQKTYEFYADEVGKIDYGMITGYDTVVSEAFGNAITAVQEGRMTKEEAMKDFYMVVTSQYPDLTVPEGSPYYE